MDRRELWGIGERQLGALHGWQWFGGWWLGQRLGALRRRYGGSKFGLRMPLEHDRHLGNNGFRFLVLSGRLARRNKA